MTVRSKWWNKQMANVRNLFDAPTDGIKDVESSTPAKNSSGSITADSATGPVDFETAILATGFGRFNYQLLVICGFGYACVAVECLCVSFLLPSAECDLELSSTDKGWLSAIIFVGMMFGGYIWGSLGDYIGRKEIIIASLMMDAIFNMLSSLALKFPLFLTLRFFGGVGISGLITVLFPYVAEFQPAAKRGAMISFVASFFMVGNVIMAGLAWAIIPQDFAYESPSLRYNSWRLFTAICASLSLFSGLSFLSLPESPRFLLAKNKGKEALEVFRIMFATNSQKAPETYPYQELITDTETSEAKELPWLKKVSVTLMELKEQSRFLFAPPLLRNTILLIIIQFVIQFAYLGLLLWLPELFSRLENYYNTFPNTTSVTVCEVVDYQPTISLAKTDDYEIDSSCAITDNQVYINGLIIAITPLPGNIWTFYHMDWLGRKFFLVFPTLGAGICALLVWVVRSSTDNLIVSSFFTFFATMAFNSLNVLNTELFPTHVRSTAVAIVGISARLGSILGTVLFGTLVDLVCAVPILLVAAFMIGGGIFGLMLPNTSKTPLK